MRGAPSRTAELMCLIRAIDACADERDRIVDDPYAKLFLGAASKAALTLRTKAPRIAQLAIEQSHGLVEYILARHRAIDEHLLRAIEQSIEQVVILGAGYDMRAHRFATELEGRVVFELDHFATSRRKIAICERHARELPPANVRRIEIDFMSERFDEVLVRAGFDRARPTFVILEGVSMYLTRRALEDTLRTARSLAVHGSEIAMDFWFLPDEHDWHSTAARIVPNLLHIVGEPLVMSLHPDDCPGLLSRVGFELVDLADHLALARRHLPKGTRSYPACYVACARVA